MNAWTSPSSHAPSPSSALSVGWHAILTLPRRLWDAYVTYLWSYQPHSWVGRVASTFRILAVLLILPVVLLTLLDVTSYVIVRTLGVVDDVKACTSDAASRSSDARDRIDVDVGVGGIVPVRINGSASTSSTSSSSSPWPHADGAGAGSVRTIEVDAVERRAERDGHGDVHESVGVASSAQTIGHIQTRTDRDTSGAAPQAYCFAAEAGVRLAGEGVFSPAASMPPSPIAPRLPLHAFAESEGRAALVGQVNEEVVLRRRVQIAREDEPGHT